MSEADEPHAPLAHSDWPLRPWVLAGLLGLAGLGVDFAAEWGSNDWAPWRAALTAALIFGPLAFAIALDPQRWKGPLAFAGIVALVMGGVAWRVALASENHVDAPFWIAAGIVAIALALPLFQAGFHRLRWHTPYDETHFHVWTDAISGAGALVFTGVSWLLVVLLAALFFANKVSNIMYVGSKEIEAGKEREYQVVGQVFFASSERFMAAFDFKESIDKVIINLSKAHFWDVTAVQALDRVVIKFRREGTEVELVGLNEASATVVDRYAVHNDPEAVEKLMGGH